MNRRLVSAGQTEKTAWSIWEYVCDTTAIAAGVFSEPSGVRYAEGHIRLTESQGRYYREGTRFQISEIDKGCSGLVAITQSIRCEDGSVLGSFMSCGEFEACGDNE